MRKRIVTAILAIAALCALASAGARAQANADPITGKWLGAFTPDDGGDGKNVSFELKYDGKEAVTGTFTGLQSPGDVKKGTFDTKTGALHLELGKQDAGDVLLTLDGRIADGVASGRISGEKTGQFRLERQKTAR